MPSKAFFEWLPLNHWTLFLYLNNFLRLPKAAISVGYGQTYNTRLRGHDKKHEEMKELKEVNMIVWSNEDCNNALKRQYRDQVQFQEEKGTKFFEYKIRSITSFGLFHE